MPKDAWARRAGLIVAAVGLTAFFVRGAVFPLKSLPAPQGDQGQMAWNLWHVAESVQAGRDPYLTRMVFFPLGANLATHTLAAGFVPVTLLVKAGLRLAGLPDAYYPFIAYKAVIFLSYVLLLSFTYLFLRRLGFSTLEAAIPAVAYAFCAFYRLHSVHLNHLAGFFIPLSAWSLVRTVRRPAWRSSLLTAFLFGVAVYFTEFALFIWMGAAFLALGLSAFRDGRERVREALRVIGRPKMTVAGAVFVATVASFAAHWAGSLAAPPPGHESLVYSANLAGFFVPTPRATPVFGQAFAALDARVTTGMRGYEVFVGFTFLALGLIGNHRGVRSVRLAWWLAIAFFVLSLGPRLKVFAWESRFPLPYAVLTRLPGLEQNRTPVRFVSMAMFAWTVPAAMGVRKVLTGARRRFPQTPSPAVAAVLLALVGAESFGANSLTVESPRLPLRELATLPAGPVLNLPLEDVGRHSALQTVHRQPIATGYLARLSERQQRQLHVLGTLTQGEPRELSHWLTMRGFRSVLVDRPLPWVFLRELSASSIAVVGLDGPVPQRVVAALGPMDGIGRLPDQWAPADRIDLAGWTVDSSGDGIRQIDVLADSNDVYQLDLLRGETVLAELDFGPAAGSGLRWRALAMPAAVRDGAFDRIRIRPVAGDERYAVRGVLLLK